MLNIFVFLFLSLLGLSGCSLKLNRTVNDAPIIRVSHDGKINSMDLESYVASVLAGEVHSSWPEEALKAQAIAARTFALLRMKERKDQAFHVQNSVVDQVYKENASASLKQATRATFGLVLTYGNSLAETSFHSTCGGKTTNSENVWGRSYE
ncbi:MAG TPA: SpoIID/LytB domain-containing protein, partial [Myxococcota bacterium]|nr:SpoIID/LytB domain-containing protein [Myxococcota bacterium]